MSVSLSCNSIFNPCSPSVYRCTLVFNTCSPTLYRFNSIFNPCSPSVHRCNSIFNPCFSLRFIITIDKPFKCFCLHCMLNQPSHTTVITIIGMRMVILAQMCILLHSGNE